MKTRTFQYVTFAMCMVAIPSCAQVLPIHGVEEGGAGADTSSTSSDGGTAGAGDGGDSGLV